MKVVAILEVENHLPYTLEWMEQLLVFNWALWAIIKRSHSMEK